MKLSIWKVIKENKLIINKIANSVANLYGSALRNVPRTHAIEVVDDLGVFSDEIASYLEKCSPSIETRIYQLAWDIANGMNYKPN